jgi:hypothetical protein
VEELVMDEVVVDEVGMDGLVMVMEEFVRQKLGI